MTAPVSGIKRPLAPEGPVASRTRRIVQAQEHNASTPLASLPDPAFGAVASCLGKHVFSLYAASTTTRSKVCTLMAKTYLADPALKPVIRQYLKQKVFTTEEEAAAWEAASPEKRAAIAAPHIIDIFQRTVEASDPFLLAESHEPTLTPLLQAQQVALCDKTRPLDKESLAPSHLNPLDMQAMGLRAQIIDSRSQARTFQRYSQTFADAENIARVSTLLGLDPLRQAFVKKTMTAILTNAPLWVQEYGPLLDPLFASFLTNPERAKTFYKFLQETAESLTHQAKKEALLAFVSTFEKLIVNKCKADVLRQAFIKAVKDGTLRPVVASDFYQKYLTVVPSLPLLTDEVDESPVPGLPLKARFPEAERFLLAIVTRGVASNATAIRDWMDSTEIKELLEKRDQALIYEQILLAVLRTISLTLTGVKNRLDIYGQALMPSSTEKFAKFTSRLQTIFSVQLGFINGIIASPALITKLQDIKDLLDPAKSAKDFNTPQARSNQLKLIANAMKGYIETLLAVISDFNNAQGLAVQFFGPAGASFDVRLQAMRKWLTKPNVVKTCGDLVFLDFSRLGLSSFPAGLLPMFRHLTELDLSHNPLREIPPDVETLRKLNSLRLATSLVSEIPPFVWHLPDLEGLSVTGSHIRYLPREGSSFYTAGTVAPLETLDLSSNSITHIPPGFLSRFPGLKECLFEANDLRGLPRDLARAWPEDSILCFYLNVNLRASNIPSSVWKSKNPVVQEGLEAHKIWEKERAYESKTPFAQFYQAVLFRRPNSELRELFDRLSPYLRAVIGLAIWNYWHKKREISLMIGPLSEQVQAVHDLHDTLTAAQKTEHGLEHLFDGRRVLFTALEQITLQLYSKLTTAKQAPLADEKEALVDSFVQSNLIVHFSPFIDSVVAAHGEEFEKTLLDNANVLADIAGDWEDYDIDLII